MGTGENDPASAPLMMTDKGAESWKPLEKCTPNEANRETVPALYEFFPPIAAPPENPISFFSSIAASQATGNQSATSAYPHIFLCHINPVEDCVKTISLGKDGKSNKSGETLNEKSEGSNKIFPFSDFQNTLASGNNQSSDKFEKNNQPKTRISLFEKEQESGACQKHLLNGAGQKHLLNCVVPEGIKAEKIYANQEVSHGHKIMPESNSNASSPVPKSMVSSVPPVFEGELNADVSIQDKIEQEKIRKRLANTLAARRRRNRQKQECEKLQEIADKLSSETSKLKETLNNYSKECIRIRRENKALLEEIKEMCDPNEFSIFEAQNPDMEDDIPSESSSSDQSVDSSSVIEEAGSY